MCALLYTISNYIYTTTFGLKHIIQHISHYTVLLHSADNIFVGPLKEVISGLKQQCDLQQLYCPNGTPFTTTDNLQSDIQPL